MAVGNWHAHSNGEWEHKLQRNDVLGIVGRQRSQHKHAGDARSVLLILICVACILACMVRVTERKRSKIKVKIYET